MTDTLQQEPGNAVTSAAVQTVLWSPHHRQLVTDKLTSFILITDSVLCTNYSKKLDTQDLRNSLIVPLQGQNGETGNEISMSLTILASAISIHRMISAIVTLYPGHTQSLYLPE